MTDRISHPVREAALGLLAHHDRQNGVSEGSVNDCDAARALRAALAVRPGPSATYIEVRSSACHAGSDGDCSWLECPQLRDGEPVATDRHCPLDSVPNQALAGPSGDADAAWEALRDKLLAWATSGWNNNTPDGIIARHRPLIEAALRAVAPSACHCAGACLCDDCTTNCAPKPPSGVPPHDHPGPDAAYECASGIDPCHFALEYRAVAPSEGAGGLDVAWAAAEAALPPGGRLTAIFETWDAKMKRLGHAGLLSDRADAAAALNRLAAALTEPAS